MNINLHIERLVLDGINIAPGQSHLLKATITNELTQLLNSGGLDRSFVEGRVLSRLTTNNIQLTNNKPGELEQKIAQSVYGGMHRE